MNNVN